MEKLYICAMHSGRITGQAVRLFTKNAPYSHVGFSFSPRLNPLYSFGRRFWFSPFPGGFVTDGFGTEFYNRCPKGKMLLLSADITPQQKDIITARLKPFLDNPRKYKYNYLNILSHIFKKPCHLKNSYVCTSFCAEVLGDILGFEKDITLITPQNYAELPLNVEYKGYFKNF